MMMYTGAVIIAAGCGSVPMLPAGGISVTQRMVEAFQKGGVDLIALVTGPADKKLEKQLAQPGLVFLHNETTENRVLSRKLGLEYLRSKCERIFLVFADRPLVAPETVSEMLEMWSSPPVKASPVSPSCFPAPASIGLMRKTKTGFLYRFFTETDCR